MILIYFTKLDAEYHVGCDCDFVSLYSSRRELISKSGCFREVRGTGSDFFNSSS